MAGKDAPQSTALWNEGGTSHAISSQLEYIGSCGSLKKEMGQ